jgi:hypothetical protein
LGSFVRELSSDIPTIVEGIASKLSQEKVENSQEYVKLGVLTISLSLIVLNMFDGLRFPFSQSQTLLNSINRGKMSREKGMASLSYI